MFRIKICGITSVDDALLAAEAGADAIGLNFYEESSRYVTPAQAEEITAALRRANWAGYPAGVFVNATDRQLAYNTTKAELRFVQLHGDESAERVAKVRRIVDLTATTRPGTDLLPPFSLPSKLICAIRCASSSLDDIGDFLEHCLAAGGLPHAVLLDAHALGSYGGTGTVLDWNAVREKRDMLMGLPLILAGGLTPENVAEAIATARPDAVDVASGVESAPGKKDPAKVRAFVEAAKKAFAALDG